MATEREILRQTAGLVVAALGDGWRVDTGDGNDWSVRIDGPGQLRLQLTRGDRNWGDTDVNRVEILGVLSHLAEHHSQIPYGMTPRRITVARDRGPEVMAREINRRLLPGLREDIQRVLDSVHTDRVATASRQSVVEQIQSVVKTYRINADDAGATVFLDVESGYGKARVGYAGDSVDIDVSGLPVDVALKILRILGGTGDDRK